MSEIEIAVTLLGHRSIRITHHLFMEAGNSQLERGLKKKLQKGKRDSATGKKESVQFHSNTGLNFAQL